MSSSTNRNPTPSSAKALVAGSSGHPNHYRATAPDFTQCGGRHSAQACSTRPESAQAVTYEGTACGACILMSKPEFSEGAAAAMAGLSMLKCPYPTSRKRRQWLLGFVSARPLL